MLSKQADEKRLCQNSQYKKFLNFNLTIIEYIFFYEMILQTTFFFLKDVFTFYLLVQWTLYGDKVY